MGFRSLTAAVIVLLVLTSGTALAGPQVDAGGGEATATGASHGPPIGPDLFTITFSQPESLEVNETADIRVNLTPRRAVTGTTVTVEEPFGFSIRPTSVDLGDIEANETTQITLSVTPAFDLSRDLHLAIDARQDGQPVSETFAYELRTDSGGPVSGAVAGNGTGPRSGVVGAGDGPATATDRSVETAQADCDQVAISGQGEYTHGGTTSPMANVTVEVWDYDPDSSNDFIAEATTAADGSFSFCIADTDTDSSSGTVDPFVVLYAENPAAVTTTSYDAKYYLSTDSSENVTDGESITFGSDVDDDGAVEIVPDSNNQAWQAVDWARDERRYIANRTDGWTRDQVQVQWPAGDWPVASYRFFTDSGQMTSQWIELPERSSYDWHRSTMLHEYGHMVMYAAYDNNAYTLPPEDDYELGHCLYSETDPGFAFVEGWAEFMEAAVDEDPNALTYIGQTVETNTWYDSDASLNCVDGDTTGEMDGYRVEGSVASILFDIIDSGNANDEPLTKPFETIFTPFRTEHPQNITHFYDLWEGGDRAALTDIYALYGVDEEPPTIDIHVPANGSERHSSSFPINGTAEDALSEVSTVEVRVGGGDWREATYDHGSWSIDSPELDEGPHTITARATDTYGNVETDTASVTVDLSASANLSVTGYRVSNTSVLVGESLTVTATVENTGELSGSTNVTLYADGQARATESVSVAANASEDVTFGIEFTQSGSHTLTVADLPPTAVTVRAPANVSVSEYSVTPQGPEVGANVTATATVKNTGDLTGSTTVTFYADGMAFHNESVTVGGGNTTTVSATTSFDTTGPHTVAVNELSDSTVQVQPVDALTVGYTVAEGDDVVEVNETVNVTVSVENVVGNRTTQTVRFYADGAEVDNETVSLAVGEGMTLEFATQYSASGTHNVTVDSLPPTDITVEAPAPDVNGNGEPATDVDGDGVYEDVDGDGKLGIVDVQLLFVHRDSDAVQNNAKLFDFSGNGAFSISDVQQLFVDFLSQ